MTDRAPIDELLAWLGVEDKPASQESDPQPLSGPLHDNAGEAVSEDKPPSEALGVEHLVSGQGEDDEQHDDAAQPDQGEASAERAIDQAQDADQHEHSGPHDYLPGHSATRVQSVQAEVDKKYGYGHERERQEAPRLADGDQPHDNHHVDGSVAVGVEPAPKESERSQDVSHARRHRSTWGDLGPNDPWGENRPHDPEPGWEWMKGHCPYCHGWHDAEDCEKRPVTAARLYHYHPWTGLPCSCPWGQRRGRTSAFQSQYLRQIQNQNQKAFRDEYGQNYLQAVDQLIQQHPDAEAMVPWMAQQYKQGQMSLSPDNQVLHYADPEWIKQIINREPEAKQSPIEWTRGQIQGEGGTYRHRFVPTANHLPRWQQWFNARQHPLRRGVNIMEHTPSSVAQMSSQHQQALSAARAKENWLNQYANSEWDPPNVQHVFGPEAGQHRGWQVVKLSPEQAEGDSQALGHCIGSDDQPYRYNIETGNINAYSLRDREGYPHVSWHVNPSGQSIGHMQGKSGDASPEYRNLISSFNQAHNLPDEEGGEEELERQYDHSFELEPATTIEDWLHHREDPYMAADSEDGEGRIGPETEIHVPEPDWDDLAYDYLNGYGHPSTRDRFHRELGYYGGTPSFARALEQNLDPEDEEHRDLVNHWNSEVARSGNEWIDVPPEEEEEDDERYGKRMSAASPIPEPPGTTPIPENYARLFHYTGADADALRQQGLRMDMAKGEEYGEPNAIWASARFPDNSYQAGNNVVEFAVPHDDPRWDIGKYQEGINYAYPNEGGYGPQAWRDHLHSHNSHVTFRGDITPQDILAVHEPWHDSYRYIKENNVDPSELEWMYGDPSMERYTKALDQIKAEQGRQSKIAAETYPQQQARWQKLQEEWPSQSDLVHEFDNGWTVQRPYSYGDVWNVGKFMRNCWQRPQWTNAEPGHQLPEESDDLRQNPHYQYHALHDPEGMPRVAFFQRYDGGKPEIVAAYGMRNEALNLHEQNMMAAYGQANGYDYPRYWGDGLNDITPTAKIAMPADPDWWDSYTQAYPYLYHATAPWNAQHIMSEGIKPSDELGWNNYEDSSIAPRPGHVYLSTTPGTAHNVVVESMYDHPNYKTNDRPIVFRINSNNLDPRVINPDEDALHGADDYYETPGWNPGHYHNDKTSLGDWAELHAWGDRPEETEQAIKSYGTLAYRGRIPAHHIEPGRWDLGSYVHNGIPISTWQPLTGTDKIRYDLARHPEMALKSPGQADTESPSPIYTQGSKSPQAAKNAFDHYLHEVAAKPLSSHPMGKTANNALAPILERYEQLGKPEGWTCDGGALVLAEMLGRAGIPNMLHVGLHHGADGPEHHHWVETNGQLIDPNGELRGEPRIQTLEQAADRYEPRNDLETMSYSPLYDPDSGGLSEEPIEGLAQSLYKDYDPAVMRYVQSLRQGKTANAIYYHVAPQSAREQIMAQGLKPGLNPHQIYVFDNLATAQAYQAKRPNQDVWQVGGGPAQLRETDFPMRGTDGVSTFTLPGPIGPERLQLVEGEEQGREARTVCASGKTDFESTSDHGRGVFIPDGGIPGWSDAVSAVSDGQNPVASLSPRTPPAYEISTTRISNLNWEPGLHGRGLIDNTGSLHTWPEDWTTHRGYEGALGVKSQLDLFIRPDGTVRPRTLNGDRSDAFTPELAQALKDNDPRLSITGGVTDKPSVIGNEGSPIKNQIGPRENTGQISIESATWTSNEEGQEGYPPEPDPPIEIDSWIMAKGDGEQWDGPYRVIDISPNEFHGQDYIIRMDAGGKDASEHPGEQDIDWEYVYVPAPEARPADSRLGSHNRVSSSEDSPYQDEWDEPGDIQDGRWNTLMEWVPTSHLQKMLEWDRNEDGDPARVQRAQDSLNRVGFRNPAWVDFNPDTNLAHLSEGNHRVTSAIQGGIPSVPVVVIRSGRHRPDVSLPAQYVGPERDHLGNSYVPQYMKPSEIGLPTTEPWEPKTSNWQPSWEASPERGFLQKPVDYACPKCGSHNINMDDTGREIYWDCNTCRNVWESVPPQHPSQFEHPDPWMDNEPGSLTLPSHWGSMWGEPSEDWEEFGHNQEPMKFYPFGVTPCTACGYSGADWHRRGDFAGEDPGDETRVCSNCGAEEHQDDPGHVPADWQRDPLEEKFHAPSGLHWGDPRNSNSLSLDWTDNINTSNFPGRYSAMPGLSKDDFLNLEYPMPGSGSMTPRRAWEKRNDGDLDGSSLYDYAHGDPWLFEEEIMGKSHYRKHPDNLKFFPEHGGYDPHWAPQMHLVPAIKNNEPISIYRTAAAGEGPIMPGAYVTESRPYAEGHAWAQFEHEPYEIHELQVRPSELTSEGNPHEFLYTPEDPDEAYQRYQDQYANWQPRTSAWKELKTAAKMDWLQARPDLQTEEGQQWLNYLNYQFPKATQTIPHKMDPLLPWMTREWKKGRLYFLNHEGATMTPSSLPPYEDSPMRYQNERGNHIAVNPGETAHWADWYHSGHGREGLDINSKQFQVPHLVQKVDEWDQHMQDQAEQAKIQEQANAPILHQYPDNWTLRRLKPEHLDYEGEAMGHCVGGSGYEDQVANGDKAILSLRDPQGRPHVTAELTPHSGMGETDNGEWNLDMEKALGTHPILRALPDQLKDELRNVHNEYGQVSDDDLRYLIRDYEAQHPEEGAGNPYALYHSARQQYGQYVPSLDKATIEQIQGRGNEVPKPEYQQRMKQWFQTFPDETRPNWEYDEGPIEHIGGILPEAESYESSWDGTIHGEPRQYDYGDIGGYTPHGDYGLVQPARSIHYPSVIDSLLRPRSYGDWNSGESHHDPAEVKALYDEAVKRGEVPEFARAVSDYGQNADEQLQNLEDQNYDYLGSYPGEEWDEDPEGLARSYTNDYGHRLEEMEPEEREQELKDYWQERYDTYDANRSALYDNHAPSQLTAELYSHVNPHFVGGPEESQWSNTPQPRTAAWVERVGRPGVRSHAGARTGRAVADPLEPWVTDLSLDHTTADGAVSEFDHLEITEQQPSGREKEQQRHGHQAPRELERAAGWLDAPAEPVRIAIGGSEEKEDHAGRVEDDVSHVAREYSGLEAAGQPTDNALTLSGWVPVIPEHHGEYHANDADHDAWGLYSGIVGVDHRSDEGSDPHKAGPDKSGNFKQHLGSYEWDELSPDHDIDSFIQDQQAMVARPWFKGLDGKGLIDNQGRLHTYAVDAMGFPHHDTFAAEKNIWPIAKVNVAPNGTAWVHERYPGAPGDDEIHQMLAQEAPKYGLKAAQRFMASAEQGLPAGVPDHSEKELRCETCGEPLRGGSCPRCNWGEPWGDESSWSTDNPRDPTRDMHRGIQASRGRRIWERIKHPFKSA